MDTWIQITSKNLRIQSTMLSAQICNFSNVFNTAKHVTAYRKFGLANFIQIQPYRDVTIKNKSSQTFVI